MISNLALVSPGAELAEGVTVEAFTRIYENVKIGSGTKIHSNVTIYPGARIGSGCEIFPGAVIAPIPQDLKFEGEETTVEIGNNTVIREGATIHRGTKDRWKTVIGSNCLLMNNVHIAHDCVLGDHVIMAGFPGCQDIAS